MVRSAALLWLCAACWTLGAAEVPVLKLARTVPTPGVHGRFDHCAIDAGGQRLFVAALGNNTLEVLDLAAGKRLKTITGLRKPTGVVYLAALNQIGVASGDDGTFKLFDGASYQLLKTIGSLDDADNVRFDAQTGLIYAGYGEGALAVIDSATLKQTGTIKLAAHPESFQLETNGNRIYVNVPGAAHVAVIDREQKAVIATWALTEFKGNFPMALDEANHRLFVGCRQPARLLVLDTATGKVSANVAISGDADDLFYDVKQRCLYVSCGEGFVDVIGQNAADAFEPRGHLPTRSGARTSFFSAALEEFFLAVPAQKSQEAEVWIFRAAPGIDDAREKP